MTTLTVTATEDYRDGTPPVAGTTAIVFSASGGATARFNSSQFGGSGISNTVAITGDGNENTIIVHTPLDDSFSAAAWTFSAWSAEDEVLFFGTADAETITGSIQSNIFNGGGGADFLTGGNQNDFFDYLSSSEVAAGGILNGLGGIDRIRVIGHVDLSLATFFNIEQLSILGSATLGADQIGPGAINEVVGVASNIGTLIVNGSSVDLGGVTFTDWNVALHSVVLNGTGGANDLNGSSQNDTITGGLGADTLGGGDGNDTFVYNAVAELAVDETIAGGGGTGDALRIAGAGTYDFQTIAAPGGIERLEFDTSSGASTARFNSSQFGGAGISDTVAITGDGRPDIIAIHTLSDAFFSAAGWTFTNWSANDNVLIFGTSAAETITGSSSQRNTINAGGGADILSGGGSGDSFVYGSPSGLVAGESVDGLGGTDEISLIGSLSYDLSQVTLTSIEELFLGGTVTLKADQIGSGAITAVDAGNSQGARVLIVNGALVDLTAVTFANWTAGQDLITINGTAGNDSLTGSNQRDTLNGGGNQDALNGGAEADTLNGEAGNDTLNGGAGLDALNGGLGNDTYVLGAENDTVTDTGGTADTITSTISRSLAGFGSVENLTLLGTATTGTGNGLANTITGNASGNTLDGPGGGDTLNGGAAADTMRGGADSDTYIVDHASDAVDESVAGSSGTDLVLASVNYSLAAKALGSVEKLTLTGAALNATGNGIANTITGNAAANILDGGDGADALLGGDGNDRLIGGLGLDSFTGGDGADTFAFLALIDTGKNKKTADIILDFTAEDFIDLSAIDAKTGGKDNRFKFIGKEDFHKKKGELHFDKKKGDVIVSGDVNGDGKADFAILLDGLKKVVGGDFVL